MKSLMTSLVAVIVFALIFATGFTCSKNTPSPEAPAVPAASDQGQTPPDPQEQMAAPPVEEPPSVPEPPPMPETPPVPETVPSK